MLLLLLSSVAENTCLDCELGGDKVKGIHCFLCSTQDFGLSRFAQAGMSQGT